MLLNLTLDDAAGTPVSLHETAKRYLTKASGLAGISATRDLVRDRPQAHGGIDDTRFTGPSLVVLEGECFSTIGISDAFLEFRTIAAAMLETLDMAPALLKWTEGAPRILLATNIATNPRAATGTTGWTNSGLTTFAAGTLGAGGFPVASAELSALGVTTAFHGVSDADPDRVYLTHPVTNGKTYTWSVYVYLDSLTATDLRIQILSSTLGTMAQEVFTTLDTWTRIDITFTATETAPNWTLHLRQVGAGACDFYWTAVLIEQVAATGVYFDGDSGPNYQWTGTPHDSASQKYDSPPTLDLQKLVKLASDVDPILSESAPVIRWQAQFRAQDPRAYSQTLQSVTGATMASSPGGLTFPRTFPITFAASAGGTTAVLNNGNRSTPPIFRLYGGCTSPQILLVGTAGKITLTGTIDPGSYLEINVAERTIRLNGTSNALHLLDPANTTWFELPPGPSTIRALAQSFDTTARCDVIFRDAYA